MKKKEIQKTGKQITRYDEPMTDISYKNKDSINLFGVSEEVSSDLSFVFCALLFMN